MDSNNDNRRFISNRSRAIEEAQAQMDQHDLIIGRQRLRYQETPPTSPNRGRSTTSSLNGFPTRGRGGGGRGRGRDHRQQDRHQQDRRQDHYGGRARDLDQYRHQDHELRRIFFGHKVPGSIFNRLEARWLELKVKGLRVEQAEEVAQIRGREMNERNHTIHDLRVSNEKLESELERIKNSRGHKQLKAEKAARAEDAKQIKGLKKENEELTHQTDLMSGLLKFNTKAHEDKRAEMQRMSGELASLREMVDAKDRAIATMDMHLNTMADASPDDTLRLALKAQAQRTLGMVQGLQKDVADRDGAVEELQALLAERDAIIEAQSEQLKTVDDKEQRLAEASALAEEQQAFISKLLGSGQF